MKARAFALALAIAAAFPPLPSRAAVQPDPGNAAAWASGVAPLADPPGALAPFDHPARIFPAGRARFAVGGARARPFGDDALARTRLGAAATRGALGAWLGVEAFGPAGARRTRAGIAVAWRAADVTVGAAWHEARREVAGAAFAGPAAPAKSGALDTGVVLERRAVAAALALRSLASGGAAVARADPDWTAEARVDLAPLRVHAAVTQDLAGTRVGGGVALAAGPFRIRAGASGAPWTWALGVSLARAIATFDAARAVHSRLGASDAWNVGLAW